MRFRSPSTSMSSIADPSTDPDARERLQAEFEHLTAQAQWLEETLIEIIIRKQEQKGLHSFRPIPYVVLGAMAIGVVILAAGQGTRMKSNLPKVLHRLAATADGLVDNLRGNQPDKLGLVSMRNPLHDPPSYSELAPLLDTPVRQLSLGQRMRSDLAAALLDSLTPAILGAGASSAPPPKRR